MGKGWKAGPRGGKKVKPVAFEDLRVSAHPSDGTDGGAEEVDKFALYQSAAQAPQGDIAFMIRVFREYVGPQIPLHLREDFCGTALLSALWCKGVDIDREALMWAARHNGDSLLAGSAADQLCLLHANVLADISDAPRVLAPAEAPVQRQTPGEMPTAGPDAAADADGRAADADGEAEADLRGRKADVVAALNFGLCLLHSRELALQWLGHVRRAMQEQTGSILVLDLLGGGAAECDAKVDRVNDVTGASFLWEQEGFSPVTRQMYCHMSLRIGAVTVLLRVWNYHWRLWTIPEAKELLLAAGFDAVHVWIRPMGQNGQDGMSTSSDRAAEGDDAEDEFKEAAGPTPFSPAELRRISQGWTAYVIGVVLPRTATE